MANGRLAAVSPTANTDTLVYQVPSTKTASISLCICNTNISGSQIRISIEDSGGSSITTSKCIEFDSTIAPNSIIERGGIVLGNQQKLYCRSSASNVNFIVYGYEE